GTEAPEVQVDGAVADGTAAGHGEACDAPAGEHGAKGADAGPHGPDQVVAGVAAGQVRGVDGHRSGRDVALDPAAQFGEQAGHVGDVGQVGDIGEVNGFICQQGGGH